MKTFKKIVTVSAFAIAGLFSSVTQAINLRVCNLGSPITNFGADSIPTGGSYDFSEPEYLLSFSFNDGSQNVFFGQKKVGTMSDATYVLRKDSSDNWSVTKEKGIVTCPTQ